MARPQRKRHGPCSQTWHKDSYMNIYIYIYIYRHRHIYIYIYICWGYRQSLFFPFWALWAACLPASLDSFTSVWGQRWYNLRVLSFRMFCSCPSISFEFPPCREANPNKSKYKNNTFAKQIYLNKLRIQGKFQNEKRRPQAFEASEESVQQHVGMPDQLTGGSQERPRKRKQRVREADRILVGGMVKITLVSWRTQPCTPGQ